VNGASIALSIPSSKAWSAAIDRLQLQLKDHFTGAEPIAFGFQAFVMNFERNVSFGLEETKDLGTEDFASAAWTADRELAAISDGEIPHD
jgi:hypothetical protein